MSFLAKIKALGVKILGAQAEAQNESEIAAAEVAIVKAAEAEAEVLAKKAVDGVTAKIESEVK